MNQLLSHSAWFPVFFSEGTGEDYSFHLEESDGVCITQDQVAFEFGPNNFSVCPNILCLTLIGPSLMIWPSLAILSYSWMAALK